MELSLTKWSVYLPYDLRVVKRTLTFAHGKEPLKNHSENEFLNLSVRTGRLRSVSVRNKRIVTTCGTFDNLENAVVKEERFVTKHTTIHPVLHHPSSLFTPNIIKEDTCSPIEFLERKCLSEIGEPLDRDVIANLIKSPQAATPETYKGIFAWHPYDFLPHWVFQQLIKWHFDLFGLIDAGEAVDIKTLKK